MRQMLVLRNVKLTRPNWLEVKQLLDEAAKFKPVPVEVAILRAEMHAAQQQFEAARDLLSKAYPDAKTRPVEVWVGLSVLEERGGTKGLALGILNEAERNLGDRIELRIARARYWTRQGGADAARALGTLSKDVEKWTDIDRRRLAAELAQAYMRIGETKSAADMWRTIAAQQDSDVGSRMVLFDLALQAGDEASMGGVVEELKGIEGEDGTLWRYCRAVRLIWQAERQKDNKKLLTEARGLLTVVRERRVNWFRIPVAEAQINELLEKEQPAIAKYREAILLGEQNPAVIRRLVALLFKENRMEEVSELLDKLREQTATATLSDLHRAEAVVALGKNDPELALKKIDLAVSPESKDYRDHLWRGQMLEAAGNKQAEAEAAFRQAIKLNNTSPDGWTALVQFAIRGKDLPKAEEALLEAEKSIPRAEAPLHLARFNEWLDHPDRAKELYDAALAAKPDDTNVRLNLAYFHLRRSGFYLQQAEQHKEQAEQHKEQAGQHKEQALVHFYKISELKSGSTDSADAKRTLALILASSRNFGETQKALKMLGMEEEAGRNDDLSPDANLADERAKVVILARQSNARQRRQAIGILKEIRGASK